LFAASSIVRLPITREEDRSMSSTFTKAIVGGATIAALAAGGAAPALAAKHHGVRTHARHHTSNNSSNGSGETALTGATLSSASAAAIAANPGANVTSATTETDSSLTGAAYEVHITKADGTKAVVIENSSFTVLATVAGACHGG
jgi:hypothetical protein